jgi:hypothetical protein
MLGLAGQRTSELIPQEAAMASKKVAKAGQVAEAARQNPYLNRLLEDEDLRQHIGDAYNSLHEAYGRIGNGVPSKDQLLHDKKLHKHVKQAADHVREVGGALVEPEKKPKKKRGFGRVLLLGVVGGVIALAVSEGLRKKLLDTLFGAEEEFEYTSTTTPPPASN